jgi:hypothetical protein
MTILDMTKKKPAPIDLNAGRIQSTSVGLKTGEVEALDAIAAANGLKRNALMRLVIREWLVKYQAGEVSLDQYRERVTTDRWKLPGAS